MLPLKLKVNLFVDMYKYIKLYLKIILFEKQRKTLYDFIKCLLSTNVSETFT